MKVVLVLLDLTLLLGLQVQPKIIFKENFDAEKIAGKWRTIAIATDSNWIEHLQKNGRMSMSTVEPQSNGKIIINTFIPSPAGCVQRTMVLKKSNRSGLFINSRFLQPSNFSNDLQQRSNTSHKPGGNVDDCGLVDTDYTSYAIIFGHRVYNGQKILVLLLYSRNSSVKPIVLQKFNDTIMQVGLSKEQMVILPKEKECRPLMA